MTTPQPVTHAQCIRAIASALVFADPPYMRNLDKARAGAGAVLDALAGIGAVDPSIALAADALPASNGGATLPAF